MSQQENTTKLLDNYEWSFEVTTTAIEQVVDQDGQILPVYVMIGNLSIPAMGSRAGIGATIMEPGLGTYLYTATADECLTNAARRFGIYEVECTSQNATATPSQRQQTYQNPPQQQTRQQRPPQRYDSGDSGRGNSGGGLVTENMAKKIYAMLKNTNQDIGDYMSRYGVKRTNEIEFEDGKQLIDALTLIQEEQQRQPNRGVTASMDYERNY